MEHTKLGKIVQTQSSFKSLNTDAHITTLSRLFQASMQRLANLHVNARQLTRLNLALHCSHDIAVFFYSPYKCWLDLEKEYAIVCTGIKITTE